MLIRFRESYGLAVVVRLSSIFSGTASIPSPNFTHWNFPPPPQPATSNCIELPAATATTARMADDSSDLSSISSLSPAPSGDESEIELKPQNGILKFFHRVSKDEVTETRKKEMSPPPRKREPSPPHEVVFADNPDIAVSREADLSRHMFEKTRKCAVA